MTHLSRALLILAAVLGFAYVQKLVALALVDRRLVASGGTGHGFEDAGCTGRRARGWGVEAEGGPYVTAVALTAEPEANLIDPKPAASHAPWIRPLRDYERRERCEFQVSRFG
jgi:hypothetical protein